MLINNTFIFDNCNYLQIQGIVIGKIFAATYSTLVIELF